MGTEIALNVDRLQVCYSENHIGMDHGMLFQECDKQRILDSGCVDYGHFAETGEDPAPMEMGFRRKLRYVLPRLELLGFTLERARLEYEAYAAEQSNLAALSDDEPREALSFGSFVALIAAQSLAELNDTYDSEATDEERQGKFNGDQAVERIPREGPCFNYHSELSYFGNLLDFLHPYLLLRLLGENGANRDCDVVWQYGPLVEAGWAQAADFRGNSRRTQTFSIATEGPSDAQIIKHGLKLLRPEIEDFFRVMDVTERHPFPGTEALAKFAGDLVKIDVQNKIVFLFDNDAEGVKAYEKIGELGFPVNMRRMCLPNLPELQAFPAYGPGGSSHADINEKAASIECYLDLNLKGFDAARVIWTSDKNNPDVYHGTLENKQSYAEAFFELEPEALGSYDVSKLVSALDALVAQCTALTHDVWLESQGSFGQG